MKFHQTFFLAVFAVGFAHGGASAASIGVSFGQIALAATDSAGVPPYAQTNWNNISQATSATMHDNTGAATTLTVSSAVDIYSRFGPDSLTPQGGDEKLNLGFAYKQFANWSFTINNIPYASYTLLVYDLNGEGAIEGIQVGGITYYTSSPSFSAAGYIDGNAGTAFIYTPSTSQDISSPTANSDYVIFNGLTGASQTVNVLVSTGPGGDRIVEGFQIIGPGTNSSVTVPNLTIISNALNRVTIRWPAPAANSFTLQQNSNIASTNWTTSAYAITNTSGTNLCTITPTTGNLFFRLTYP